MYYLLPFPRVTNACTFLYKGDQHFLLIICKILGVALSCPFANFSRDVIIYGGFRYSVLFLCSTDRDVHFFFTASVAFASCCRMTLGSL